MTKSIPDSNTLEKNYYASLTSQVEELANTTETNYSTYKSNNTVVYDTGATPSCGKPDDNFIITKEKSNKKLYQQS